MKAVISPNNAIIKSAWDENGIPALGKPCSGKTPVPSWEKKYQKFE